MRTLESVSPISNYKLECTFSDGTHKIADVSVYLDAPAFKPLTEPQAFLKVINKKYFVEWSDHEIDLSADTLWHIGENV